MELRWSIHCSTLEELFPDRSPHCGSCHGDEAEGYYEYCETDIAEDILCIYCCKYDTDFNEAEIAKIEEYLRERENVTKPNPLGAKSET